jgi:C4-dicarboxylate-specific signal transduction histidine kinase
VSGVFFAIALWLRRRVLRDADALDAERREIISAQQRASRVLESISRIPGISVLEVDGASGAIAPRADSGSDGGAAAALLPKLLKEYVSSDEFAQAVRDERGVVRRVYLSEAGEDFEVQLVVANLGPTGTADASDLVVVAVDQTAQRIEEHKLYQMSKMAALGELITGLAHEINQPLSVIKLANANIMMLTKQQGDRAQIEAKSQRISSQVDRIRTLIDHMRTLGRGSTIKARPCRLSDAIDGVLGVLGADIESRDIAVISKASCCPDAEIPCPQEQMEQVLMNLILNARDAILDKREKMGAFEGRIEIGCDVDRSVTPALATVFIRDNAGGVPQLAMKKIFQPFFTTKEAGKGTGLGLSISAGIIRNWGGTISVENSDVGATFKVELPTISDVAAQCAC